VEAIWKTKGGKFQVSPLSITSGKVPAAAGSFLAVAPWWSELEGPRVYVFFVGANDGRIYEIDTAGGPWSAPQVISQAGMDYRGYGLAALPLSPAQLEITAFWEFTLFGKHVYFFDEVDLYSIPG
jgi:hypothetical protein